MDSKIIVMAMHVSDYIELPPVLLVFISSKALGMLYSIHVTLTQYNIYTVVQCGIKKVMQCIIILYNGQIMLKGEKLVSESEFVDKSTCVEDEVPQFVELKSIVSLSWGGGCSLQGINESETSSLVHLDR